MTDNNIKADIIDLKTLRPLDYKKILKSAKKTKKVLIVDNGWVKFGVSAEIASIIAEKIDTKVKVKRIGVTDAPIPSTVSLAKFSYPDTKNILNEIKILINKKTKFKYKIDKGLKPDQPDSSFLGPF